MNRVERHRQQSAVRRRLPDVPSPRAFRAAEDLSAPEFDVLRLQRAAGNQAVQRLLGADSPAIQRSPKKEKEKTDHEGRLRNAGWRHLLDPGRGRPDRPLTCDGPFVIPGAVDVAKAALGKMIAADGTETPPQSRAGDRRRRTRQRAGRRSRQRDDPQAVTFTGKQFGVPVSGGLDPTKVIDLGKDGQPVAPKDLPAALQPIAGSRVELEDGHVWVLMTYPTGGTPLDALTWAASRDSRKDYKAREAVISAEAAKLPADLKTAVDKHLKIISLVSLVEGNWGSVSPGTDPMASLGIFQWGMSKRAPVSARSATSSRP